MDLVLGAFHQMLSCPSRTPDQPVSKQAARATFADSMGEGPNKISWRNAKHAMSVRATNKRYLLKDIQRRHFNVAARRWGIGETAEPIIEEILAATPDVIISVEKHLPKGFPQHVLDAILNGLSESAKRLEEMAAS